MPPMPSPPASRPPTDHDMRQSYVRVLFVWVATLAGLYVLQILFV